MYARMNDCEQKFINIHECGFVYTHIGIHIYTCIHIYACVHSYIHTNKPTFTGAYVYIYRKIYENKAYLT